MGGVDICGVQLGIGHATGIHEFQATVDFLGQRLVAGTCWGVGHELAVPLVQAVEVRGAGASQRAHQVHCCRSVSVCAHHAGRIVLAGLFVGFHAVDEVTAVAQQAIGLAVCGAGLRVLASDTSHLHHRGGGTVSQHHGHLQQGLDVAANVRFGVGLEGLGAVATLQQECLAQCHVAQLVTQPTYLRCHHDRRDGFEDFTHACSVVRIPRRLLLRVTRKHVRVQLFR